VTISSVPIDQSVEGLKAIAESLLRAPVEGIDPIAGGRNSRVYRLAIAPSRNYAFKTYFRHTSDSRHRMRTEFESLKFLWENGERQVPQPIAASDEHDCAIYQWIDGEKISPGGVTPELLAAAAAFLSRLAELKRRPGSEHLPPASEACFSGGALVTLLRGRLQPLLDCAGPAELSGFLAQDLVPAIDSICQWSRERLGDSFERELPREFRTLSPSDFGFHNALQASSGVVFLDMEYFGWDDPAKMICDFLLHPAMSLSSALKRAFANAMRREFPQIWTRVEAFYPLFALKWCIILLNEFLPAQLLRRRFAGLNDSDREARQGEQLAKAVAMFRSVRSRYDRFPYVD
jgi:hypothetical protein